MKRVLFAGVLMTGLLVVGAPTMASSAGRHSGNDRSSADRGSDHHNNKSSAHHDSDHHDSDHHRDRRAGYRHRGYYHHRYGYGYGYYPGYYYGDYGDCYHDPSGYTTCEPYGGDYDPGGYNGRYTYGDYDPNYCDRPHSAHSARCDDDPAGADNGVPPGTVVVRDHAFNPATINARVGEAVVWNFDDNVPHTVTADNGSFDSGKRSEGEFQLRFDRPGTYSYHCAIHPDMKGMVMVGRES
ncbi:MAG TPA: cupredoxin domain-containing protein [Acidimicrobiia bacterium]|nr:cupredoxin domain-containing protein [Acidimicrobiia bacterium]